MPNGKNLKPFKPGKDARERGRKGGEKSGEARRERKTFRAEIAEILSTSVSGSIIVNGNLREVNNKTLQNLGALSTVESWIKTGNHKAMRTIAEIMGELESKEAEQNDKLSNVGNILVSIRTAAESSNDKQ
jgi:endo-alpha-1,4-polygalactosaminidase (GH114 family)